MILHAHLFKNAGTTLDWSLARSFGEQFLAHTEDDAIRHNPAALAALVQHQATLQALSSHWLPLPLTEGVAAANRLVLLLRHPIIRAQSVYLFERRQTGDHGPSSDAAKRMDFASFVRWRLEPGRGPVINNFQTRYLSGAFGRDCDEQSLRVARATLQEAHAGIVERYNDSMILFESELGDEFPRLDLASRPQNVSGDDSLSDAQRLQQIEAELGDTYGMLLEANAHDLALYQCGLEQLNARLAQVENLVGKRKAFQLRCEALA